MSALGSLVVKMALEYAQYTTGLNASSQESMKFAKAVQDNMDKAKKATSDFLGGVVTGALAAVASYQTVSQVIDGVKASIDRLDNISKVSQRVGVAAATLQELAYAGDLADVPLEALATSAKKLSVFLLEASNSGSSQASIFKALGIEAKNADGSMRSTNEVMADLADEFEKLEDGPLKTALAIKIFGKAGADMIPLLNGGKKAFQESAEEARKFGLVIEGGVLKQAEAFNDNLTRLGKITEGTFNQLSSSALPVLVAFSDAMVKAASDTYSVNSEAQDLAKNGTLFEWAKSAAIGLTYVIDAAEGAWRVIKGLGQAVGATFAYIEAARDTKLAIDNNLASFNFSGAIKAATSGAAQMKTILSTVGEDLGKTFPERLTGNKIRDTIEGLKQSVTSDVGTPKGKGSKALRDALGGGEGAGKADKEAQAAAAALEQYTDAITKNNQALNDRFSNQGKVSDSEKLLAELMNQSSKASRALEDGDRKRLVLQVQAQIAKEKIVEAIEKERKANEEAAKEQQKAFESLLKQTTKLEEDARAEEEATAAIGLSKKELAERTAARYEDQAAQAEGLALKALEKSEDEATYELYKRQAQALRDKADATRQGAAKQGNIDDFKAGQDVLKKIDDFLDPSKAKSFGDALNDAFGSAGNALKSLGNALQDYTQKQSQLNKLQEELANNKDISQEDRIKREMALSEKQGELQVASYAAAAGAAKGFFAEGSRGYKVMQAAETAFQAYQLASDLVKGVSAAAVAVANQAQGDPYTAFARMAAMAAAMAALGFAVTGGGGGGGGQSAKQVQEKQGTGTVLGDASAKSDSLSKSLEGLQDIAKVELQVQSGMLKALNNIEASMAGLGNVIARIPGLTEGKNLGIQEGSKQNDPLGVVKFASSIPVLGNLLGSVAGAIFGKTTQKIVDAGLTVKGSVADLSKGQGVQQYASVDTTKSSLFGLSKKTSNSVQTAAADDSVSKQIGLVFANIGKVMVTAAGALGKDTSVVGDAISKFIVDIPTLSLKDLKGDELQAAISTAISAQADVLGAAILPGLDDFQKVGEGYFETLVRVAGGIDSASFELEKLGISAVAYTDVLNKQGDVATEIVRQSIQAVTGLGNVGQIIENFSGSAEDLAQLYGSLVQVQDALRAVGVSGDALSNSMIRGAGGLDKLASSLDDYLSNFYSKEEQTSAGLAKLGEDLSKLGIDTVPASRKAFRELVESIDPTTDSGGKLYAQLIGLSGAFADLVPDVEDTTEALRKEAAQREAAARQLNTSIDAAIGKFQTPEEQRQYKATQISADLSAVGVNIDVGSLLKATKDQIYDFAKSFVLAGENSVEAKQAVVEAASALADLRTQADAADAALANKIDSVVGDFLSGDALVNYKATRIQDTLAKGGLGDIPVENIIGATKETVLDFFNAVGTDGKNAILDAYGPWKELQEVIHGASDALKEYKDSTLAVAIEAARLKTLKPEERVSALKTKEKDLFGKLSTSDDPIAVAQELQGVILSRIQEEVSLRTKEQEAAKTALEKQIEGAEKLKDLSKDIAQFTGSLKFGELSPLSARGQVGAAKDLYTSTLQGAKSGDATAISNLLSNAQAYLEEASSAFASSGQYASIFNQVTSELDALGLSGSQESPAIELARDQLDAMSVTADNSTEMLAALLSIDEALGIRLGEVPATTSVSASTDPLNLSNTTKTTTVPTGTSVTSTTAGPNVMEQKQQQQVDQLVAISDKINAVATNTAKLTDVVVVLNNQVSLNREGFTQMVSRLVAVETVQRSILTQLQVGKAPV